jgi:hypothetical protein
MIMSTTRMVIRTPDIGMTILEPNPPARILATILVAEIQTERGMITMRSTFR